MIYLDNATTTPVNKEVLKEMLPYFSEQFGHPSSIYHTVGAEAKEAVENSRRKIAEALECSPGEIFFTNSGSEANKLALRAFCYKNKNKGMHIITSNIEHSSITDTLKALEKDGFKISKISVNEDGLIKLDELKKAITKDTILICVSHANNEIGVIQPVKEISKLAEKENITFFSDCCYSFPNLLVKPEKLGINMLSVSAHKMGGPKGIGFLYVQKGIKLESSIFNLNKESVNVPLIVGLGKAVELSIKNLEKRQEKLTKLRDKLIRGLLKIENSWLNGSEEKRTCDNVNIGFRYVEGESIILSLDMEGIVASTGSACAAKTLQASHVLLALGQSAEKAHGSVRLTLSDKTTDKDIVKVIKVISEVIKRLRSMSAIG